MKKFDSVDSYMAQIAREDFRKELERVRVLIRGEIPEAEEVISYGMPAFRLEKVVVWIAAFKDHLSLFGHGSTAEMARDLVGFKTSKGTVQFTPEHPLPDEWIRKIVRMRIAEIRSK